MAALAGLSSSMAAVQTTSSAKSSLFGASLAAKPMTAQPHAAPSVIRMAVSLSPPFILLPSISHPCVLLGPNGTSLGAFLASSCCRLPPRSPLSFFPVPTTLRTPFSHWSLPWCNFPCLRSLRMLSLPFACYPSRSHALPPVRMLSLPFACYPSRSHAIPPVRMLSLPFTFLSSPSHPPCSFRSLRRAECAQIKRWERKEVKDNSLPVRHKLHVHVGDTVQVRASGRHRAGACEWATPCRCVRVGDTVQVIAGRDKGKVTEVVRVINHNSSVLCRDINIKTKHVKGKAEGEAGQIIQMEAPIHSSNVMLYSKQQKVTSRVGHKVLEDGSKVRYLLKTGEVLDQPSEWKRTAKKEKKDKPKGDSL
ncbi:unnamed protein product [Closterium sp. NIES-64]|nr:unnamed protein product [Closterium sp. NIES-64]